MPNYSYSHLVILKHSDCEPSATDPECPGRLWRRQKRQIIYQCLANEIQKYIDLDEGFDDKEINIFNILRPRPSNEEENWYEWNCQNWGTKWEAGVQDATIFDNERIELWLQTAWGPPVQLMKYLVEELRFDVYLTYASPENQDWGFIQRVPSIEPPVCGIVGEETLGMDEDDVANLLRDAEVEDYHELLQDKMLGETFDTLVQQEPDRFNFDMVRSELYHIFENAAEEYQENIEESVKRQEAMQARQKILARVEKHLEEGKIDEGRYLEVANHLKNCPLDILLKSWEETYLSKLEMINFYKKDNIAEDGSRLEPAYRS